ncbi:type VI secretion system protein TssR domain-containing protein [Saccharicrinis fermentans]|uniref:Uncharacterized protein n=1 Tax=Saccharicrinis fermentans DSM 9555 = JCM 21142 TaxID=869213 RepID=W7Y330_9BACT|nr:type VI secretion system protein TssR domain-containing protein [Saccharicrinis fermentans]GAF05240.1 hypothetical protein JCM21142_93967 [Saccharicrinis fermentans DSM 9555 = JCM 21142]
MSICFITACGPVNVFTRIKKTPKTHSYNYCIDELKAAKSIINKKEWIVYSDREKNTTTMSPGGKIKFKDLEFLEPLLVIGHHRGYLKVLKYDPAIVKNGSLADRKKAEYYGWIHQSKLLLDNQSVTDIRSGLKKKSILAIADTLTVNNAHLFFEQDSVKLFKNPNLYNLTHLQGLYDIVYIMKRATERNKVLISKTPYISPDNVKTSIIGWVNDVLIQNIGQQLFINNSSYTASKSPASRPNSMRYSPVLIKASNNPQVYKTASLLPVIDRSDNCIFNVNGNTISFKDKIQIEKELEHINVLFYIEPGQKTMIQLPALINSFQNMNPIFRDAQNNYSFQFSSVIANYQAGKLKMDTVNFTDNINDIITQLVRITKGEPLHALPSKLSWKGLGTCMDIIEQQKPATNLVVVFGEKGQSNTWDEHPIARRAAQNNCRFLAYQMFSDEGNDYNNFVTQFTDLIHATAQLIATKKRERIVYSDQLRKNNVFEEKSKNAFYLDFPKRSMTQGGIYFPEKSQTVDFNQLNTSIDSFIQQIKADHQNLVKSINKAFITVGNSKDKYDASFLTHFNLTQNHKIGPNFKKSFQKTYPLWYQNYIDTMAQDSIINYQLLLSEKELENIRTIVDNIAELNVDTRIKIVGKTKKTKTKKACDCPDEFFTNETPVYEDPENPPITKYLSTRKSRKTLKNLLLSEIYTCNYCKTKTKPKKQSLAKVSELIFQAPTKSKILINTDIKSLTKRKFLSFKHVLSDEEFETLLEHYKMKKSILDREINDKVSFTSAGENYYWVNADWLP